MTEPARSPRSAGGGLDAAPAWELRSSTFRRERDAAWLELELLVEKAEKGGTAALDAAELHRLPVLYRGALSSLSVARSIALDRNLVAYLESLSSRAYLVLHGARVRYRSALVDFFAETFPQRVREIRWQLAAAILLLVLGVATGFLLVVRDPGVYYLLMPEELASGRDPMSSRAELEAVLRGGAEEGRRGSLSVFASFLFSHNAQIGMLCFVLGVAAGVPTALLLFSNGLVLGAFAAIHWQRGLSLEMWGWLLPHGVTELLAVALCGAAGMSLGLALVFPGRYRRLDALALAGRRAALVVMGAVGLFLVAGLIEGYFRQLVTADLPRYAVVVVTALLWALYFGGAGRRR